MDTVLSLPPIWISSHAVRFFSNPEIDQARTDARNGPTANLDPFPGPGERDGSSSSVLLPPIGLTATTADDGVRLTWTEHPSNPSGATLRTQLYRWTRAQPPRVIYSGAVRTQTSRVSDAGSRAPEDSSPGERSPGETFFDPEPCPGTSVSYALLTVQLDRVEGVEVRRSAMSETVNLSIEPRFEIRVTGFAGGTPDVGAATPSPSGSGGSSDGASRVRLEILDLRAQEVRTGNVRNPTRLGESTAAPSEDAGAALGITTGWTLQAVETETRDEVLEIAVPRFEDDGSRTLENGAPAFRVERAERPVPYPVVRLRDRCGQEKILRVGAPAEIPVR